MEDILEMEEEYTNIYIFYEINNNSDNLTWYYEDIPDYMGWFGRRSTFPLEKDVSGNWSERETLYPRTEKFYCITDYKKESINYLNNYYNELLKKNILNRFVLSEDSKPPEEI